MGQSSPLKPSVEATKKISTVCLVHVKGRIDRITYSVKLTGVLPNEGGEVSTMLSNADDAGDGAGV